MAIRMQQRRGTSEQWNLANPVLGEGEIGWESDSNKFKIGDGINAWADLSYFADEDTLGGSIDDYVPLTAVGVADGVASLDATGNVPLSELGNVDFTGYATETYVDNAVSSLVDSAPGLLDTLNELAAAIGDDENFVTTINTSISSGDSATLASAEAYADGLAANYDPAGSAATAESNANTYTDNAIAAIPPTDLTGYATEAYADQAEADAKSYSDSLAVNYDPAGSASAAQSAAESYADGLATNYDPAGSASAAESNANTYTDSLIGDITVDGTSGNTVTDRIATAVAGIVDSAPATLDTLNELAAALGDDANFATTVTNSIASKADASHTHVIADVTDYDRTDGIVLSTTAPASPVNGLLWVDTTTMIQYVYYSDAWVEI